MFGVVVGDFFGVFVVVSVDVWVNFEGIDYGFGEEW